ncbi:MAG: sulfurtransferase [Cyanobacteria bacterium LVE1205-1]
MPFSIPCSPIVSVTWLAAAIAPTTPSKSVVVIDCRFSLIDPSQGKRLYTDGHIPGAYHLDLSQDLSGPVEHHGGRHPLPDVNQLTNTLRQLGVDGSQTWVVAYDDSRFAFASRLWWLMRYLGHDRVVVLDGGFSAWREAGYPISTTSPPLQEGQFLPRLQSHQVVDIEVVAQHQTFTTVALVDSREKDRYRGEREPIDPIAGHIPGAMNLPWTDITTPNGFIQPIAFHQKRWQPLQNKTDIIVYCGSGVTACVNLLSLEVAGLFQGKLYPGSWSDWCSYPERPIASSLKTQYP